MLRLVLIIVSAFILLSCSEPDKAEQPLPTEVVVTEQVSFDTDIRPIIEKKCIACHGCFDAPCQLKLESKQGLIRGATLSNAYDGTRKDAVTPTRLFIDADNEEEWRSLNFFSILDKQDVNASILSKVLALGQKNHFSDNAKLDENITIGTERSNQCAVSSKYSTILSSDHLVGMPFAVSGLTKTEYSKMTAWLEQGAKVEQPSSKITADELKMISSWESYLNQSSKPRQLVSRWLYEHLFLAHLYFSETPTNNHYFELVRSYTAPGNPIQVVKTRLPNDDPKATIFYRLRLVEGATVHKRHISLIFDNKLRNRIEELFFAQAWTIDTLPAYGYSERANPFITFSSIPAKARYQFMLDNAEYFTRTFIRGPVCRGQIATDVIRDRFWIMFQKPDRDLYITDPMHRDSVNSLLGLPGQDDNLLEANGNWERYKDQRNQYHAKRYNDYGEKHPEWASLSSVWQGRGVNDNALLTVFRNYDNASVRKGFIGSTPTTLWWMDYPLFERSYYELVVNFDVFGNVAHQLQTRLYFDLLRNGAEHNFLRLMPIEKRKGVLDDWYGGLSLIKTHITYAPLDIVHKSYEQFDTAKPKRELADRMLNQFRAVNAMNHDPINRCSSDDCSYPQHNDWVKNAENQLSGIASKPFSMLKGLDYLPELTFLRVNNKSERVVYSLLRNRSHSNVAFLFGESLRYQPKKDTLTLYPGIGGSYPNFIFDVPAAEMESFVNELIAANSQQQFDAIAKKWGVRRTHPDFWDVVHDFTAWQKQHQPLEAGIFDVNRYENL